MPFASDLILLLQYLSRVFGMPLILSFCCPGYQNQCCVNNINGWSFPYFLIAFFFCGFPPKSSQLTFLFRRILMGLTFTPFLKASKETFQNPFLVASPCILFLQIGRFFLVMLKRSPVTFLHGSPFSTLSEVLVLPIKH